MMLASCSQEIKFHDWETNNCYGVYQHVSEKAKPGLLFTDLSWSCEGTYLAAVQNTGKTMLLKPHLNPIFRNDPFVSEKDVINVGNVKCAQFSKTQNHLLGLGTVSGHVIHHNLSSKYSTVVIENLPTSTNYISYAAEDSYLAVGCKNGQIFIVQVGIGITESYFVPQSECITALTTHSLIPKYLAGGSDKGVIAVWDVNSACFVMQTQIQHAKVMDIAFSLKDDTFTAIHDDQRIGIYDLRVGECVHEKHFDVKLTTIAYSPRGNDVAVGTERGHILTMDRRYLRSSKTSLKAHSQCVKKLKFQHERSNHFNYINTPSPAVSRSSVHQEPEREIPDLKSDVIVGQAGDFMGKYRALPFTPQLESANSLPVGLPENLEKNAFPTPTQQAVEEMSLFHIIDERSLHEMKQEILQSSKDLVDRVVEKINNDFLKMRMNVSRQFCNMELRNRERWQEFDDTLLKLACLDDQKLDEELRRAINQEGAVNAPIQPKISKAAASNPPADDDHDISEEISYVENVQEFSDHMLDNQDVDLDEIDYLDNDSEDVSAKHTLARASMPQVVIDYNSPAPSTSQPREVVGTITPRYTSKLPRHKK